MSRALMMLALEAIQELRYASTDKAELLGAIAEAQLRKALSRPDSDASLGKDALDAKRYRQYKLGNPLVVKCKSATIITGPHFERDYGEALDSAIDAAIGARL